MLLLRNYLQTKYQLPRRKIIRLIDEGEILLNDNVVTNYKNQLLP
ncbi:MAG: hypothetical protein Q4B28_04690 [bacterium]|nr:hypothetical protein [bacterium]